MTPFHFALHIGAGLFGAAGVIFASAAVILQRKGWKDDAFECTICALACALATVVLL